MKWPARWLMWLGLLLVCFGLIRAQLIGQQEYREQTARLQKMLAATPKPKQFKEKVKARRVKEQKPRGAAGIIMPTINVDVSFITTANPPIDPAWYVVKDAAVVASSSSPGGWGVSPGYVHGDPDPQAQVVTFPLGTAGGSYDLYCTDPIGGGDYDVAQGSFVLTGSETEGPPDPPACEPSCHGIEAHLPAAAANRYRIYIATAEGGPFTLAYLLTTSTGPLPARLDAEGNPTPPSEWNQQTALIAFPSLYCLCSNAAAPLTPDTTYWVRCTRIDEPDGPESDPSDAVEVTTLPLPPTPDLTAGTNFVSAIAPEPLPTGATGLDFRHYDSGAGGFVVDEANVPAGGTGNATGLLPDTEYFFDWMGRYAPAFQPRANGPGASITTSDGALPTTPPPPNITDITQDGATAGYDFSGGWPDTDSVFVQVKGATDPDDAWLTVSAPLALPDVLSAPITGYPPNTPLQARIGATNSAGTVYGPFTAFSTLDSDGNPGGGGGLAPEAPGEVDDTDVTDVSIKIEMPPLPTGATTLRLFYRLYSGTNADYAIAPGGEALTGSSSVIVSGLTLSTKYRFLPVAVNDFGATPGPVHDTRTEGVPTVGTVPDKPVTPTAVKSVGRAVISFGSWPARAATVALLQDGVVIHTFDQPAGTRSFAVTGLVDFETYVFTLLPTNGVGDGPESDPLTVVMIDDGVTLAWVNPPDGETVHDTIGLVASVTAPDGLWPVSPVRMTLFGSPLPGVAAMAGTPRWTTSYDTNALLYQGEIVVYGLARGASGLWCAPVPLHLLVNNTLENNVKYHHWRYTHTDGGTLTRFLLDGLIEVVPPGQQQFWIDLFVTSPAPAGALEYDDFAAMEAELLKWQWIHLDATLHVEGTAIPADGVNPPDNLAASNELDIVVRLTPVQKITLWPLGATGPRKMRPLREGQGVALTNALEIVTHDDAKLLRFTRESLSLLVDLDARGMGDAVDAVQFAPDKVLALAPDRVKLLDLTDGDRDATFLIDAEDRPGVAVEAQDGLLYVFFGDADGSTVYETTLANWLPLYTADANVLKTWHVGDAIYWATADHKLRRFKPGDSATGSTVVLTHSAAIADVLVGGEDDTLLAIADADKVWGVGEDGSLTLLADLSDTVPPVLSLAEMVDPATGALRAAAGVSSATTYAGQVDASGFLPLYVMADALAVPEMERLHTVWVAAQGDPLHGGTPEVASDDLVIGVRGADGLGYVALVQRAKLTSETSYLGGGLSHAVLLPHNLST